MEKTGRGTRRGLSEALQIQKEVMGRLRSDPNDGMRGIWETFNLFSLASSPPPIKAGFALSPWTSLGPCSPIPMSELAASFPSPSSSNPL